MTALQQQKLKQTISENEFELRKTEAMNVYAKDL
jgi:hypothetical protein